MFLAVFILAETVVSFLFFSKTCCTEICTLQDIMIYIYILPPFQNDYWIPTTHGIARWSSNPLILLVKPTTLIQHAHEESSNHSGTEGVLFKEYNDCVSGATICKFASFSGIFIQNAQYETNYFQIYQTKLIYFWEI